MSKVRCPKRAPHFLLGSVWRRHQRPIQDRNSSDGPACASCDGLALRGSYQEVRSGVATPHVNAHTERPARSRAFPHSPAITQFGGLAKRVVTCLRDHAVLQCRDIAPKPAYWSIEKMRTTSSSYAAI